MTRIYEYPLQQRQKGKVTYLNSCWIEGDNVVTPMAFMNHDTGIFCANVAFAKMFGYASPMEATFDLRDSAEKIFESKRHYKKFSQVVKDGSVKGFEAELVTKNRTTFWGELKLDLLYCPTGKHYWCEVENLWPDKAEEDIMKLVTDGLVTVVSNILGTRDSYTSMHQRRVAAICRLISEDLHLPRYIADGLYLSALIHDIGKICVPLEYLSKPGALTKNERGIIASHAQAGYDMLKRVRFPWPIAEIVFQHHESLDGSGYPRGLKGHEILFEAKVIAVADTVEAIIYDRPYRARLPMKFALDVIQAEAGTRYDPFVVESCVQVIHKVAPVNTLPKSALD